MIKNKNSKGLELDILKIIIQVYKNKNFIIKFTFLTFLIGFLQYKLEKHLQIIHNILPHYEEINNSTRLSNLADFAGINIGENNKNNIPTSLYPKLISSNSFKLKLLSKKVSINNVEMTYKEYLSNELNSFSLMNIITYQ